MRKRLRGGAWHVGIGGCPRDRRPAGGGAVATSAKDGGAAATGAEKRTSGSCALMVAGRSPLEQRALGRDPCACWRSTAGIVRRTWSSSHVSAHRCALSSRREVEVDAAAVRARRIARVRSPPCTRESVIRDIAEGRTPRCSASSWFVVEQPARDVRRACETAAPSARASRGRGSRDGKSSSPPESLARTSSRDLQLASNSSLFRKLCHLAMVDDVKNCFFVRCLFSKRSTCANRARRGRRTDAEELKNRGKVCQHMERLLRSTLAHVLSAAINPLGPGASLSPPQGELHRLLLCR